MNVLILGAGASKSYSDSPTGERMPIANDFFNVFNKLAISENPFVIIGAIVNYIIEKKKIPIIEYFNGKNSIEEFHSEVERDFIQTLKSENPAEFFLPQKANSELLFLFASVINEIQNGPISRPHCNLANFLSSEDVVITFNWDTLMDRALNETTEWSTDSGYFAVPKRIYRDGWVLPQANAKKNKNYPLLLKLHGSTNWITSHTILQKGQPVLSQAASPDTLHVYESTTKPFPAYEGRYMEGYEPFSYGYYPPNIPDKGKKADDGHVIVSFTQRPPWRPKVEGDKGGLTSMPLIIPPVKQKNYDMFGSLFGNLWGQAEADLSTAEHIIIIGYSFPRTDQQSNELFINAFMKRTSIPRISIIDPSPQNIADKFIHDFGIPSGQVHVYKDYFSEEFDIKKVLKK
jgi:hypothetical protein